MHEHGQLNLQGDHWYVSPALNVRSMVTSPYRNLVETSCEARIVAESRRPFFHLISTTNPPRARRPETDPSGQAEGKAGRTEADGNKDETESDSRTRQEICQGPRKSRQLELATFQLNAKLRTSLRCVCQASTDCD